MARHLLSVSGLGSPTAAPFIADVNAALSGLLDAVLVSAQIVVTDALPAYTRQIQAIIEYDDSGTTMTAPFEVVVLESPSGAALVAQGEEFLTASTGFVSPVQFRYSDQLPNVSNRYLSFYFTNVDLAGGAANYQVNGSSGGSGTNIAALVLLANHPGLPNVQAALDQLLYINPAVTGFTNNVNTVEIGQTINNVLLTWSYNKAVVSQSITPAPGSLAIGVRSSNLTGQNLTADTTYSLSANDGTNGFGANTGIYFRNKRFWGASAVVTPPNGAFIDTLQNNELSSGRAQSRIFSPGGNYIYFAWPSSYGTPTFVVGGFASTGWVKTTVSYTNAQGYAASFDIWRSQYPQSGAGISVVVS